LSKTCFQNAQKCVFLGVILQNFPGGLALDLPRMVVPSALLLKLICDVTRLWRNLPPLGNFLRTPLAISVNFFLKTARNWFLFSFLYLCYCWMTFQSVSSPTIHVSNETYICDHMLSILHDGFCRHGKTLQCFAANHGCCSRNIMGMLLAVLECFCVLDNSVQIYRARSVVATKTASDGYCFYVSSSALSACLFIYLTTIL